MPELLYLQMYRKMLLIRLFEEQARDLFMKNMMRGATTCISARRLLP